MPLCMCIYVCVFNPMLIVCMSVFMILGNRKCTQNLNDFWRKPMAVSKAYVADIIFRDGGSFNFR